MAALLRGVARSVAVVAPRRAAADHSTRTMASLPGFIGVSRPTISYSSEQLYPLSSSAAFLVYRRLSVRPQVRRLVSDSKRLCALTVRNSQDGQVLSMEESTEALQSKSYRDQPRDTWTRTRVVEGPSSLPGSGQNARSTDRPRMAPTRNFYPRTRFSESYAPTEDFKESRGYRSSSTPFRPSREFSSSAVLEGFDDNEGSDMDVETYKKNHEITTTGNDVPDPFMTFSSTGFSSTIMKEFENAGFTSPSAIQAMTWPVAIKKRDIVAVAKTGSGKTLGYLLPAFLQMERERTIGRLFPSVLVLAPTRELANQIREEAWKFGRSSRINVTCVSGGSPKGPQLRDIERGVDVIVATPGRLNDLLEMNAVNLKKVSYLVLDEADRMLDMGFEPQIRAIVDQMSAQRQTLMYTATWPHEVRRIAGDLMSNPVQVNIGNSDQLSANKAITQHVEIVSRFDKDRRLEEILAKVEAGSKTLIFCTTKRMCDDLAMNLRNKVGALAIHGDKSQRERDYVMNQFKRGRTPVLVATDVAARGLDIKDIGMVINYDFPTGVEDYVHRIGRTGRAGATGIAHTFFGYEDAKHAAQLIKVLESTGQAVTADLRQMAERAIDSVNTRRGFGSRYGGARTGFGSRSQTSYYTGKTDSFGSGSRWGQSDSFVSGSKWGQSDSFGSGSKWGQSDNPGSGSSWGQSDSLGSGSKWGQTDRLGTETPRFGSGSSQLGGQSTGSVLENTADKSVLQGLNRSSTGGLSSKWGSNDDSRLSTSTWGQSDRFSTEPSRQGSENQRVSSESSRLSNESIGLGSQSTPDKWMQSEGQGINRSSSDNLSSKWGSSDNSTIGSDSPPSEDGFSRASPTTPSGGKWSQNKGSLPRKKWPQQQQSELEQLKSLQGYGLDSLAKDKSFLTPKYGELKMNPDGSMSLW